MVAIDLSGIASFIPVFAFLLVFAVVYALLSKTKALGENKFVHIFVSLAIAVIFLVSANAVEYIRIATPWFAAFVVSLLFIALIVGLVHPKLEDFFSKGFVWFIIVVLLIIFVSSAIYVFAPIINKYFAGPKEFLAKPQVLGTIVLLAVAALVAWLLAKGKK